MLKDGIQNKEEEVETAEVGLKALMVQGCFKNFKIKITGIWLETGAV